MSPSSETIRAPEREYRFSPSVGRWRIQLARMIRVYSNKETAHFKQLLNEQVEDIIQEIGEGDNDLEGDEIRFAFACSILLDIVRAGGSARVVDSEIYVSWPDWNAPGGRRLAYKALNSVAEKRPPTKSDLENYSECFATNYSREEVINFLSEGSFWLEPVNKTHPTGVSYHDLFRFSLRYWTMPYRGREGRMRRFVVVGDSDVETMPVVVGIIEVGDDAPYNRQRDEFIGLRPSAFIEWLDSQGDLDSCASKIMGHFRQLRSALDIDISTLPAREVLQREKALQGEASGRSLSGKGLFRKKKLAYLLRLAHGEIALESLIEGAAVEDVRSSLTKGIRAVHNLSLPRLHLEATICGAIPPFAHGLGGKLVTSFLGHPEIVSIAEEGPGQIVEKMFLLEEVTKHLPMHGLLSLTTKGLYPNHSAQYNRAELPGEHEPLRLERIGKTKGETTTLLSRRTGQLARALVRNGEERGKVAEVFGAGGAKRHRMIEEAMNQVGLPKQAAYAGINRPIYGVRLAKNIEEVIWLGAKPQWLLYRGNSDDAYCEAATECWRDRWLETAIERVRDDDSGPSNVFNRLDEEGSGDVE